jgi:hypothetical protein
MRCLAVFVSSLVLAACGAAPPDPSSSKQAKPSTSTPVEFLLTSAATDFRAHRPPYPSRFRDVRIGYLTNPDGTRQYRMCGAFLPASEGGKAEWIPFATIQTSGYEQYVGGQAATYCGTSSFVYEEGDFSSSLQNRLDSLK